MPAPQPPFILVDNVYDRINLYPAATVLSGATVVGREAQYAADYRRERTYFQIATAAANQPISVDLGAGNTTIVDSVWLDRGHNLWGKTVDLIGSNDAFSSATGSVGGVVPALGTVGGDPTVGWCVTEEGALYQFFAAWPASRYFRFRIADAWQYILTGIVLGKRVQLSSPAGWSSVRDEDAGERSDRNEASLVPGYEGYDRTYSARSMALKLSYIGATEYDAAIRGLRRTLFDVNQPAVMCYNYGTNPERAWLFRYRGKNWSSPMTRAYRTWSGDFFEVGPLIR
jgi:hypothetical protein